MCGEETVLRDLLSPPPEADRFVVPRTAYALGIGIVGMMIALKVVSSFAPASNVELTEGRILSGLGLDLALQLVTYAILGLTVLAGPRPPRWRAIRPEREVLLGLGGFAAAVGPVLLLMIASQPLRTETSEHQFLQILRDSQSPLVMGLICVSAAVVAPLSEELTYRVILMGERGEGRSGSRPGRIIAAVCSDPRVPRHDRPRSAGPDPGMDLSADAILHRDRDHACRLQHVQPGDGPRADLALKQTGSPEKEHIRASVGRSESDQAASQAATWMADPISTIRPIIHRVNVNSPPRTNAVAFMMDSLPAIDSPLIAANFPQPKTLCLI